MPKYILPATTKRVRKRVRKRRKDRINTSIEKTISNNINYYKDKSTDELSQRI